MKQLPDGCVEAVITDPPYGMKYESGWYKHGNPFGAIHGDDAFPVATLDEFERIATCAVLAFCRWDNLADLPKPKSLICWVKNNHTAGDLEHAYGRRWEAVAFWPLAGHRFLTRPADVLFSDRLCAQDLLHPTQKPECLMMEVMEPHDADTILDPYCGSGTTLVAAKKLGRHFLGFEISPEYCQIARDRLAAIDAQPSLFDKPPEQMKFSPE